MKKVMMAVFAATFAAMLFGATRTEALRAKFLSDDREYVFVAMHRGDWRNFPENSRSAILSAIALGADIVEIDVRRTKDGRLVLMHDANVDRVTNGHGAVADMTQEELQSLRFVKDGKTTDEGILTLEDALELTKGRILVNIDRFTEHPQEILAVVSAAGATKEVIVKSTESPEATKALLGEYWPLVESGDLIFMPVVQFCWSHHAHAAEIFPKWLAEEPRKSSVYEICFDDAAIVAPVLGELRKAPNAPRLWLNAMWDDLSAEHSDRRALLDPATNWGWCLREGATLIQTDCGAELILYLTRNGRHSLGTANKVLVASHRADWKLAPENSLSALENSIRYGVDIVETDVRRTKDGHLVILHDPHVARMTNGQGYIADMTLEEIKRLNLRDALGQTTAEKIPTLEEYMLSAKGRVRLYLDKAGQDGGALVPQILELAKKCGTLEETVFVLDWPYEKARAVFGDDLEKVLYCPVIEDKIANLDTYVDEWLANFKPFAFQFRFASTDTRTFSLLPKVLASGSRAFVAATWYNHTAGHDDRASLIGSPEDGWGWLVERGFTILETNFPREMKSWLKQGEAK